MRTAVIDSSPLIALTHLGLITKLVLFFDLIYVPRTVQREVNRKGRFRYKLGKLFKTGGFEKCFAADDTNVKLLTDELDPGEAEALIQGQERMASYFIGDEKRAREIGQNMGLNAIGTVRILCRLHLEGHAGEPRALVRKLRRDLQYRVTDEVVAQAIRKAEEAI